jgi:hypothetical protein
MKEAREKKGMDRIMKEKKRKGKERKQKRREERMNVDRNESKQSCESAATEAILYPVFPGLESLQG